MHLYSPKHILQMRQFLNESYRNGDIIRYIIDATQNYQMLSCRVHVTLNHHFKYEVVQESSRTVTAVTASVKDEVVRQVHTSGHLLHQSAT
jgi:hypothetical protein